MLGSIAWAETERERGMGRVVFDNPPKMMKYIDSSGDCTEYVDQGPADLSHMLPRGSALKRCQRALEE
ncbi:hypothetical protein PO909_025693 [Leuciscus waleckii]